MKPRINPGQLDRFADKPELRDRLIKIYQETALDSIANIETAWAQSDFQQIGWHAHVLKGASMTAGAEQVTTLSSQLQDAAKAGGATLVGSLVGDLAQCTRDTVAAFAALIGDETTPP